MCVCDFFSAMNLLFIFLINHFFLALGDIFKLLSNQYSKDMNIYRKTNISLILEAEFKTSLAVLLERCLTVANSLLKLIKIDLKF